MLWLVTFHTTISAQEGGTASAIECKECGSRCMIHDAICDENLEISLKVCHNREHLLTLCNLVFSEERKLFQTSLITRSSKGRVMPKHSIKQGVLVMWWDIIGYTLLDFRRQGARCVAWATARVCSGEVLRALISIWLNSKYRRQQQYVTDDALHASFIILENRWRRMFTIIQEFLMQRWSYKSTPKRSHILYETKRLQACYITFT